MKTIKPISPKDLLKDTKLPAEVIDKINKDLARNKHVGGNKIYLDMDEMFYRYRNQIVAAYTQEGWIVNLYQSPKNEAFIVFEIPFDEGYNK